jgi:hypothetical protein
VDSTYSLKVIDPYDGGVPGESVKRTTRPSGSLKSRAQMSIDRRFTLGIIRRLTHSVNDTEHLNRVEGERLLEG